MSKKSFTLFFLSSAGKKVKKIHLSKNNFFVILCLVFLGGGLFLYVTLDYITLKHQSFENAILRSENSNLHQQLNQFNTKVGKIEQTLTRINTFATKLRVITKFEDPDRLHRLAIGPISKEDYNSLVSDRELANVFGRISEQAEFSRQNSSLTQIEQRLKLLDKASYLQEQSLGQLQELLEDQKSLMRSLPALKPTDGWITSGFGPRISPFNGVQTFHEGIDFATRSGTIITAPADGLVTFSGVKAGYGNTIVIDHGYGIVTTYGHNSVHFVKAGDRVKRGDRIGTVGNTGRSTGPHLHYEVAVNGIPQNPAAYILDE